MVKRIKTYNINLTCSVSIPISSLKSINIRLLLIFYPVETNQGRAAIRKQQVRPLFLENKIAWEALPTPESRCEDITLTWRVLKDVWTMFESQRVRRLLLQVLKVYLVSWSSSGSLKKLHLNTPGDHIKVHVLFPFLRPLPIGFGWDINFHMVSDWGRSIPHLTKLHDKRPKKRLHVTDLKCGCKWGVC